MQCVRPSNFDVDGDVVNKQVDAVVVLDFASCGDLYVLVTLHLGFAHWCPGPVGEGVNADFARNVETVAGRCLSNGFEDPCVGLCLANAFAGTPVVGNVRT